MPPNDGRVIIEDVELLPGSYKNFSGRKTEYNREGDRNFNIKVPPELAAQMIPDGWNVKQKKDRVTGQIDPDSDWILQVHIGYKIKPPLIALLSSNGRQDLGPLDLDTLDWVDIAKADIVIQPGRRYENFNGRSGVKAWVKSLFITVSEDYLDLKYADVPRIQSISAPQQRLMIEASQNYQIPTEFDDEGNEIVDAELVD